MISEELYYVRINELLLEMDVAMEVLERACDAASDKKCNMRLIRYNCHHITPNALCAHELFFHQCSCFHS